jgi:excisionase family DNA binding protein
MQTIRSFPDTHGGPLPGALSPAEAAVALGVSVDTIRRRIRAGELKSFKVGALVRVPRSEVDRIRRGEGVPA